MPSNKNIITWQLVSHTCCGIAVTGFALSMYKIIKKFGVSYAIIPWFWQQHWQEACLYEILLIAGLIIKLVCRYKAK